MYFSGASFMCSFSFLKKQKHIILGADYMKMNYLGNHGDLLMKANLSSVSYENVTSKEKEM